MANKTFTAYANELATASALDSAVGLEGGVVKTGAIGGATATIVEKSADFTADGDSGTVYVFDSSGSPIVATLQDSAIGTQYTFINVDSKVKVTPDPANTIVFFNSVQESQASGTGGQVVPGSGDWVEGYGSGASISFLKITATVWSVVSSTGVRAND